MMLKLIVFAMNLEKSQGKIIPHESKDQTLQCEYTRSPSVENYRGVYVL